MVSILSRCVVLLLLALSVRSIGRVQIEERMWTPLSTAVFVMAVLFGGTLARLIWPARQRGAKQMSFRNALSKGFKGDSTPAAASSGVYFGGVSLPPAAATSHFAVVGSTGSGKSLTLRMLMGSVLPSIFDRSDQRAVIYDVKKDTLGVLRGILTSALAKRGASPAEIETELTQRLLVLNPFDRRCHEWAIARDVDSPELALQIATILIPEEEGHNRYFSDAARDLLAGVMDVFIQKSGDKWTFGDLLVAMRSPARLEHVLSLTEEGRDLIDLHLMAENTTRGVVSTARSKLAPFDVVAALWGHARRAGRSVSLCDFLKKNQVLVLGNHQAALAPIRAINRVIFQRLTELILDQTEDERRRTWFFLDEVRKLEKLEGLDDLMTNGRSKGACVVLGFQAIEGMEAVYGKEVAGEIVSMCGSFGILRVAGARTPQWASEVMGEQEIIQSVRSHSQTLGGDVSSTSGQNEQIREKRLFLPSHFRLVPRPERGKPLCGYFCSAFLDSTPYFAEISPQDVERRLLPVGAAEQNFQPWPAGVSKRLPAWTQEDYLRLGIPPMADGVRVPAVGFGGAVPFRDPKPITAPRGFVDPFVTPENQPRQR